MQSSPEIVFYDLTNNIARYTLSQPVLSVKNLTKKFGEFKAVDNLSMDIEKGKITLVIGPNGSGKTTMLNCVSRLYPADEGQVFFRGEDVTNNKTHELVEKGLVRTFQVSSPFTRLTVLENLLVSYGQNSGEKFKWAPFSSKWKNEEKDAMEKAYGVLELLEITELAHDPAYTLSGGQLKLLEIGRALMTDAKMILTDEPAGSVSVILAEKIFSHIRELCRNQGLDFLLIEHRLDIASKYVDYVYAMDSGSVLAHGKPKDVFEDIKVIESYLTVRR
jgi:branched-chain amino acid transport system ATP-binding protein